MTAKRQRGFEIVSKYKDAGIELPVRKTAASAGYDLQAAEDVILLPHAAVSYSHIRAHETLRHLVCRHLI